MASLSRRAPASVWRGLFPLRADQPGIPALRVWARRRRRPRRRPETPPRGELSLPGVPEPARVPGGGPSTAHARVCGQPPGPREPPRQSSRAFPPPDPSLIPHPTPQPRARAHTHTRTNTPTQPHTLAPTHTTPTPAPAATAFCAGLLAGGLHAAKDRVRAASRPALPPAARLVCASAPPSLAHPCPCSLPAVSTEHLAATCTPQIPHAAGMLTLPGGREGRRRWTGESET